MSINDKERSAKVQAIENILFCLNDAPFKPEMAGIFYNIRQMAETILKEVEQVEVDFENAHYEARVANHS